VSESLALQGYQLVERSAQLPVGQSQSGHAGNGLMCCLCKTRQYSMLILQCSVVSAEAGIRFMYFI
jgi:hypothetical protein